MNKFVRVFLIISAVVAMIATAHYTAISALLGGVHIVLPADKTYVEEGSLALVISVDPSRVDTVSFRVNGIVSPPLEVAKEPPQRMKNGVLYICREVSLDDGQNMLSVVGYAKGKVVAYEHLDVFYVLKFSPDKSSPPESYRKPMFHTPEGEAVCAECHASLREPQKDVSVLKESPCYKCHKGVLSEEFAHGPAAVGDCASCHGSKDKQKYAVPVGIEDICFRCHEDKKTAWKSKKFQHGPAATGDCTICHAPHSSAFKLFLKREVNELCIGCHEEKKTGRHVIASFVFGSSHPVAGEKNPLMPERSFSCASCHSPHASNSKEMFAMEAGGGKFSTCQACHKK